VITKYILFAVYAFGYGPRVQYTNLGEFDDVTACKFAGNQVIKAGLELDLTGHEIPKMICLPKALRRR
jgi:hypothetical protein